MRIVKEIVARPGVTQHIGYFAVYDDSQDMALTLGFVNEVAKWCKEMTGNQYDNWTIVEGFLFKFEDPEHQMLFELAWI